MGIFGTMKDVYHLESLNFVLDPAADWICYFGRGEIKETLQSIILKSLKAGIPPKLVVWGNWGIGKTQTIFHFMKTVLEQHSAPIYVECPEFARKTNFLDFHDLLLRGVGVDRLVQLVRKHASVKGPSAFNNIAEQDFRHLCQNVLTMASGETLDMAWTWIAGGVVRDKSTIGVRQNQITTTMAVSILEHIGEFFLSEGRPVIFCVDESHRLGNVEEESDQERTFIQAIRRMTVKNFPVGLIFAIGAGDERGFPHMFVRGEVKDRIGDYFVPLPALDDPDIREMSLGIIRYVRDGWDYGTNAFKSPKSEVTKQLSTLKAKGLNISGKTYPFTEDAIDQILVYFNAEDMTERRTPREICDVLNDCATEEDSLKQGYIDGNIVSKVTRSRKERIRPSREE